MFERYLRFAPRIVFSSCTVFFLLLSLVPEFSHQNHPKKHVLNLCQPCQGWMDTSFNCFTGEVGDIWLWINIQGMKVQPQKNNFGVKVGGCWGYGVNFNPQRPQRSEVRVSDSSSYDATLESCNFCSTKGGCRGWGCCNPGWKMGYVVYVPLRAESCLGCIWKEGNRVCQASNSFLRRFGNFTVFHRLSLSFTIS